MLQRWHPESLGILQKVWPLIQNDPRRSFALFALRDMWRYSETRAVQQLVSIASATPSKELRQAAVRSLAALHSSDTLSFLATLLQSTDSAEQMQGVFGLASYANGCPMQTMHMWRARLGIPVARSNSRVGYSGFNRH
jgi:hypothetical protein